MSRDLFAREALALIPKILTLQDRNAHSPTYGCFDRNFWHYKIIDFPSGMAAEFVWPLALAHSLPIENNPYFQQPAIKEWVAAGIRYAARSAHPDGSCDDYFPFEKAAGAAAFSLLAGLESYKILGLHDETILEYFAKRTDWLADHHESGRLTNHQALIVVCLELAGRLFESSRWEKLKIKRLKRVLDWQDAEGWFQEYEGADPGYHTLTCGLLAQYLALYEASDSKENASLHEQLRTALEKAISFATHFVHPDGSFGGEYTSRNTYNYFPHGFEIAAKWFPTATTLNDRLSTGLARNLAPCYADDHILGHHGWSYLLAWQHWREQRPAAPPPAQGRTFFKNAGIVIERRKDSTVYLALNKGGACKLFRRDHLVHSDTGFSVATGGKKRRIAVSHLVGKYKTDLGEDKITIAGRLGWAKTKQMTTFNLVVLRAVMFTVGRFFPDLIRKLLQKVLITGKKSAPYEFQRELIWLADGGLEIGDTLRAPTWTDVEEAGIGTAQTSIYVVMSRTFQAGQLETWHDLTPQLENLPEGEPLIVKRKF
jgi:hypothetical protein